MAGQTINDRIIAARHTIAGQGLAKSVCKATTEEMIGPKKKHLDYLIHCTNEPNVSIPQLATLLIERSQSTNWVVVYKSLITCHHLMCYGNERFTQYLASSNSTFQLSNFLDKSGVQGIMAAKAGYDMSPFIRRYARYLNEKALAYRTVAFDFCKVKRGKDDSLLRTMGTERLLKTLPALQNLLDALLEFDCSANDLTNSVINVCFMLLFRDLIRLFACYNDAIINLLEKYFDMNKKQCREALDLYKKFLIRMDRVGEFLKVAENVGIDKGDIPDLTKAPSSLLDALEQHLASIEGKKGSSTTTPTQAASNAKNVKSGVHALSSTSSSFGSAVTHNDTFVNTNGSSGMVATSDIDEGLRRMVLAEEEAAMNQYKSKLQSPSSITSSTINNPFLTPPGSNAASPPGMQQQAVDLFATPISLTNARASDDLLQLSNPFADAFALPSQSAVTPVQAQQTNNLWVTNGLSSPQLQPPSTEFVPESSFSSVFGTSEQTAATSVQDDNTAAVLSSTSATINPFIYEPDNTNISEYALNSVPFDNSSNAPETTNIQSVSSTEDSVAAKVAAAAAAAEFFRSDLNMYQESYDIPDLPLDNDSVVIANEHADTCLDVQIDQTGDIDVNVDNSTDDKISVDNVDQCVIDNSSNDNKSIAQNSDEQSNDEICEEEMPPVKLLPPSKAINKPPRPPPPTVKKDIEQVNVPSVDNAEPDNNDNEICIDLGSPPIESEIAIPGNSPAYPSIPGVFHSDPIPSGMMMMNQGIIPLNPLMVPGNVPMGNSMSRITVPLSFTQLPNPAQLIPTNLSGQSIVQTQTIPNYQIQNIQGTNATQSSGFDAFGGILKPASTQGQQIGPANTQTNATQSQNKVLTGDLDSSLASLAENLSINSRPAPIKGGILWNSPKNGARVGSSIWTPQPMAATTGAGYRPMGQGMASAPMATMQPLPFQPQMTMGIRPIATMVPAAGMMTGPIGMVPQIPPLPTQMPLQAATAAIPQQHQQQGLQFH